MLNVRAAAKRLGCSPRTIFRRIEEGTLQPYKVEGSKAFWFKESELAVASKPKKVQKEKALIEKKPAAPRKRQARREVTLT